VGKVIVFLVAFAIFLLTIVQFVHTDGAYVWLRLIIFSGALLTVVIFVVTSDMK